MYQGLNVISIEATYSEKKIKIFTNFDINPETVNQNTVTLYSYEQRTELILEYNVINKMIEVSVIDDITPNFLYTLKVSMIENVVGEKIDAGVKKDLIFKSDISEIPTIIEPSNFSEVIDTVVKIDVDIDFEEEECKYIFLQISKNITFDEVTTIELKSRSKTINVTDLETSQYYIRARIETSNPDNDIKIGRWSEITTFNVVESFVDDTITTPNISDDYEPIFRDYIKAINSPTNGETPKEIIIEFDKNIDIEQIESITLIRRDI